MTPRTPHRDPAVHPDPLTFDPTTRKVALLNFWGTVAWVQRMRDILKKGDRSLFLMGNDAFYRRWQLAANASLLPHLAGRECEANQA